MFCFSVLFSASLTCMAVTEIRASTGERVTGEDATTSRATREGFDTCCCTSDQGLNITVSPGPVNPDVYYGYRYTQGTEINVTCSFSRMADQLGSQGLIFILRLNEGPRIYSEPSATLTILILNSTTPQGEYWLGCVAVKPTSDPSSYLASGNLAEVRRACIGPDSCCSLITLVVGHRPPQPKDFWCVSYEWSSLICSWTVGSGTDQTEWSVTYWPPTQSGINVSPTTCESKVKEGQMFNLTCAVDASYFLRFQTYRFQLTGINKFGSFRQNVSVETDLSIVKLPPVNKVTLVPIEGNPTVLNVSWEPSKSHQGQEIECRLGMVSSEVWGATDRSVIVSGNDCQSDHAQLEGLHPYTTYLVQVQLRHRGSRYWSDAIVAQVKTAEAKPSQSPELTAGGHVTWDCEDGKCLRLYSKSVPAFAQNGIITGYHVTIRRQDNTSVVLRNYTETQTGNSLTTTIPRSDDVTVEVCLSAGTSAGFSWPPSCIVVPERPAVGVPSAPEQVNVERLQGSSDVANTYLITWLSNDDVADYITVFWCRGPIFDPDVSRLGCRAEMTWTNLSADVTNLTLNLNEAVGSTWYFGVSRTRANVSQGITWNRCVYDYRGVPEKPRLQVSAVNETGMIVSWDFNTCDLGFLKGLPVTYQIFYKRQTEADPSCLGGNTLNVTARAGVKEVALRDLDRDATYGVCMRILTARNASDVSDVRAVSLAVSTSEDKSNVGIFTGVLVALGVVFAVASILLIRWKLLQKAKKFLSTDATLPKPKNHVTDGALKPAGRCLGSCCSQSLKLQKSRGAETATSPTGGSLFPSRFPPVHRYPESIEEEIGDEKAASLVPVKLSVASTNGYLKAVVEEDNSGVESTNLSRADLNPKSTPTHCSVGESELSPNDSLIASENGSRFSAEYCTVLGSQHSGSKKIAYGVCHSRAQGQSPDGEDSVDKAMPPLGAERQGGEYRQKMSEDKVLDQPLEGRNALIGYVFSGVFVREADSPSLICCPDCSGPSLPLPSGHVPESWGASCSAAKNQPQVDRDALESLSRTAGAHTENEPRNPAYVSEVGLLRCGAEVSDSGNDNGYVFSVPRDFTATPNSKADCREVNIELAVSLDSVSSPQTQSRPGCVLADGIPVLKTTHPAELNEAAEPRCVDETSVSTPQVNGDLRFSVRGFNDQTQKPSSRDDQNGADRTAYQTGYVPHEQFSAQTSLATAPGDYKRNGFPEAVELKILPVNPFVTLGEDNHVDNVDHKTSTQKGKPVVERQGDVPENDVYVGRDTVEPQARWSSCSMPGVCPEQQYDNRAQQPDGAPATSSQYFPLPPYGMAVQQSPSFPLSSVGVAEDLELIGVSVSISGPAAAAHDVTGCDPRRGRERHADSTTPYITWREAPGVSLHSDI